MTPFQIIAVILTLTAAGGYINYRYMRLSATIGNMVFALLVSLPAGPEKEIIIPVTYIVVLFSILVQGLIFQRLATATIKN